jgi:hypothetical protein
MPKTDLCVGDIVKIRRNDESFWNIITSIKYHPTGNIITATVDNYLLQKKLSYGSTITFKEKKILDIYKPAKRRKKKK